MKNKIRNIFFLFGIVAIIIMMLTFNVSIEEIWHHVTHAGSWLVAVLGMWVFLYLMNALTWRIIILGSGDCPIPFWKLFKITITGFALNYATPAGLMGGEPYKILELTPYVGKERATSSVLLFAMTHIFAHFWYWLSAVILFVAFMPIDHTMAVVLPAIGVFALLGIYMFIRGYKYGIVVKCIRLIARIPGLKSWGNRFLNAHIDELNNIDGQIAQLQGQNKCVFLKSFALEYVGRVLQSFEIFFLLRLVDVKGSLLELFLYAFVILAFTSLFANLLFFMPLQIGGREGGFAMSTIKMRMIGASGLLLTTKEAIVIAVFISIICRIRELFWTVIGMVLIKCGTKVIMK